MSNRAKFETKLRNNIEAMIDYEFGDEADHDKWREALSTNMDEYHDAYISGVPMDSVVSAITGYQVPEDVFID